MMQIRRLKKSPKCATQRKISVICLNNVIDTFGRNVVITDMSDGNYKFSLTASPSAMRFWLLQYGKYVKLLLPQSLVKQIKSDIKEMSKLYS